MSASRLERTRARERAREARVAKTVCSKLPIALYRLLEEAAQRTKKTRSTFVRDAVRDAVVRALGDMSDSGSPR